MSTSAHKRRCYLANNSARDIANSLFQKWAVKGFFRRVSAANRGRGQPRRGYRRPKPTAHSDVGRLRSRRAACFLWYFLSRRKKVLSPSGRQPHLSRRSRRVIPPTGISYNKVGVCRCMQGAFRSPPAPLRVRLPKQINVPVRWQAPIRAVVGASFPPGRWVCACGHTGGFPREQTAPVPHFSEYAKRRESSRRSRHMLFRIAPLSLQWSRAPGAAAQ